MTQILPLGAGRKGSAANALLTTGQLTQYSSELDDGYYKSGTVKSFTVNTTGSQSGTTNIDLPHLVSSAVSFDAATKEIRGTGLMGVFKAAGGETIVVTNSTLNNGTFTTASATADKIVVTGTLVDESAGASLTIAKREALSNNTVKDNKTGLTWLRYVPVKFGALGTGLMPWTGQVYDIFAFAALANTNSLGGYTDWRVPNDFELGSLRDMEAPSAVPDSTAFPSWPTSTFVWTSTTRPNGTTTKMVFIFSTGEESYNVTTAAYFCALVRG